MVVDLWRHKLDRFYMSKAAAQFTRMPMRPAWMLSFRAPQHKFSTENVDMSDCCKARTRPHVNDAHLSTPDAWTDISSSSA
jgi:hypothetical protein